MTAGGENQVGAASSLKGFEVGAAYMSIMPREGCPTDTPQVEIRYTLFEDSDKPISAFTLVSTEYVHLKDGVRQPINYVAPMAGFGARLRMLRLSEVDDLGLELSVRGGPAFTDKEGTQLQVRPDIALTVVHDHNFPFAFDFVRVGINTLGRTVNNVSDGEKHLTMSSGLRWRF